MNIYYRIAAAAVFLLFSMTSMCFAEAGEWKIDKAHSNIYFEISHTYAKVRGKFGDFSGNVVFKPENPSASSVELKVRAASINTHITKRDNHLRSEEFFDVEQYPYLTFSSTDIRHDKGDRYIVEGKLTIRDVTRNITVPFTYMGMRDNPLEKNQKVAGFEADFTINRLDYNVGTGKFAEMGVVGEKTHILITLELLKDL